MKVETIITELVNYFEQQSSLQRDINYTGEEAFSDALEICKNALIIEKQQIKDAFDEGYRQGFHDGVCSVENGKDISEYEDAENYYNDTFKK